MTQKRNPAPRCSAETGSVNPSWAAWNADPTTKVAILKLRGRFGLTESVAVTVARLAGIGPREARHG